MVSCLITQVKTSAGPPVGESTRILMATWNYLKETGTEKNTVAMRISQLDRLSLT